MGLDYNYYVYSKKEYKYEYTKEGLVVENIKTKTKRLFDRGSIHIADMNTWYAHHSIEAVKGIDEDIFIVIEVT